MNKIQYYFLSLFFVFLILNGSNSAQGRSTKSNTLSLGILSAIHFFSEKDEFNGEVNWLRTEDSEKRIKEVTFMIGEGVFIDYILNSNFSFGLEYHYLINILDYESAYDSYYENGITASYSRIILMHNFLARFKYSHEFTDNHYFELAIKYGSSTYNYISKFEFDSIYSGVIEPVSVNLSTTGNMSVFYLGYMYTINSFVIPIGISSVIADSYKKVTDDNGNSAKPNGSGTQLNLEIGYIF